MDRGASNTLRTIASAPVLLVITLLASAVPILSVAYPPVLDYPNHLARIWLLSGKVDEAPLSSMYAANWSQASTNIAVDFIASSAARIVPIGLVNTLLLLAMFLGPPIGTILLNRAIGRAWHGWQIAALFLAWSTTAIAGFLNFQIGLAAALACAALFARRNAMSGWPGFGTCLASAVLLLLIHPFALFFYAALGSGLILGDRPALPRSVRDIALHARALTPLALACLLPLLGLFLFAPTPPGVHANGATSILWSPLAKMIDPFRLAKVIASPVLTYDARMDLLILLPFAIAIGWAALSGRIRFHTGLLIAAVTLTFLACLAPEEIGDASWIQRRLPPMAALTLVAAILPARRERDRMDQVLIAVIATTLLLRIGGIEKVWLARQPDFAGLGDALGSVPRGAALLVSRQDWTDAARFPVGRLMAGNPGLPVETGRHLVAPFAVRGGFFIPTLFTVPGQQPLSVMPAWRSRSVYISSIPFVSRLGTDDPKDPYVRNWNRDFDYLLVLNADMGALPAYVSRDVTLVSDRGFARLYRIRK